jgi:hypothetical protein
MMVYEFLTLVVVVVLGAAATVAVFLGLLNWMGGYYVVRCDACHHLTSSSANHGQPSCAHCRHPVLMHPVHSALHGGQVRVRADPLRY